MPFFPGLRARPALAIALCFLAAAPEAALANNYGESLAWQFMTPAERAAAIARLDLIAKRQGGYFATPVYNTQIERQYNCSNAATATGNSGYQNAVANSPTVTGAVAQATGNQNSGATDGRSGPVESDQVNSGAVLAGVNGGTTTTVQGAAWQALNSNQTNSGNQTASVSGSTACMFGALNG